MHIVHRHLGPEILATCIDSPQRQVAGVDQSVNSKAAQSAALAPKLKRNIKMNVLGMIINFFFPGVGSIVIGKVGQGITQILLFGIGFLLMITVILSIIGVPLMMAAWLWGLVTAATTPGAPVQVTVIHKEGGN